MFADELKRQEEFYQKRGLPMPKSVSGISVIALVILLARVDI